VLGLDVGGSHSRALLAATDGTRLGAGAAAGGNPVTHGPGTAVERIAQALVAALGGDTPPAAVAACVIGIAGAGRFATEPDAAHAIESMAAEIGLRCGVRLVSDVTVAFAAGTARADGALLLSGTGAVAARMRGHEPVEIRDGYGWLLGDEGSGFWIGREAVRATLAAIDGRVPMTELPQLVLRHFVDQAAEGEPSRQVEGTAGDGADGAGSADEETAGAAGGYSVGAAFSRSDRRLATELVRAVGASPTVAMAALAPSVMAAYELGDPAAERIVVDSAARLVESLAGIGPEPGGAIVLAGSVLTTGSPVQELVVKSIAERWPQAAVGIGADGAAGAAWLAIRDVVGEDAVAVHRRLTVR
jgi:N-acetylglucosamine kinase-like BadF-type ATPase